MRVRTVLKWRLLCAALQQRVMGRWCCSDRPLVVFRPIQPKTLFDCRLGSAEFCENDSFCYCSKLRRCFSSKRASLYPYYLSQIDRRSIRNRLQCDLALKGQTLPLPDVINHHGTFTPERVAGRRSGHHQAARHCVFPFVDRMESSRDKNLGLNFLRLLLEFRQHDLVKFSAEHDRLFREAKEAGDHTAVTRHYYAVMSPIINRYFSGNFHFVPPERPGQSRKEAAAFLHRQVTELLGHGVGKHSLDIGCGIGGAMIDVASLSGGKVTGVTIAPNEAEMGNRWFRNRRIDNLCSIMVGDCNDLPMEANTFDSAYAIYALKYFGDLQPVFQQVNRVLKPDGLFVVYDLVKTNKYDKQNAEHRELVEGLEYACGMPALHTNEETIRVAEANGMQLVRQFDLAEVTGRPFHECFSGSILLMWLIRSVPIDHLISIAQAISIMPKGFHHFNKIFLAGTVLKLVEGGRMGILSGSNILLFRKRNPTAG